MSGSVAPGQSVAAGLVATRSAPRAGWDRSGSGSYGMMLALHSPNRLADAAITAGFVGSSTSRSMLELGLDPLVLDQADGLDPADLARRAASPARRRPGRRRSGTARCAAIFFWLTSVSLSQSAPAIDQRERRQHREADGELVVALHAGLRPALDELPHHRIARSAWISATVPTCRIAPSYSMAIRSPTVKALRMSWVTTTPVTPRSRRAHHELVHDRRGDRIEPGGRLVIENVAGPERDRPGDPDPLPHAAARARPGTWPPCR